MASRLSSLGNALVIAGSVVGGATAVAVATGAEIILTPAMIQLLVYKGLAAAALGLIVAGSWIGRRGRQQEREEIRFNAELTPGPAPPFESSSVVREKEKIHEPK